MKKVVRKSVAPLYVVAVTWVLYALLFPLYKVSHIVMAVLVTAVMGVVAKRFCKDVVEEVKEEPKKEEPTGNPELDKLIDDYKKALSEMQRLNDAIADEKISADIVRLEQLTTGIFQQVKADPTKLPQIRKFMNYYLPTTLKLLNAYDRMSAQGISGENVSGTIDRVSGMMDNIVAAFEKQLDSLFGAEALDISTDITVLENMMAREGLTPDDIHKTASEDATQSDGGIQLEL